MEKRAITIDNGGSELRYISNSDDRSIHTMEKLISVINPSGFRVKDNVDPYDVVNVVEAPQSEFEKMFATGRGYYMYDGVDIAISNSKKTSSLAWYQQVIMAIATDAMKHVKKLEEESADIESNEFYKPIDTSFEYVLTTLIPVKEHSGDVDCASKLKDNLSGEYRVVFPAINSGINSVSFKLNKECIGVLPEGVVALTCMKDTLSSNDYTLIIDMGHVTTDLAICKGTKLLGASVVSSPYAGGTILKLIGNVIRGHGVIFDDNLAVDALKKYSFHVGKKEIDISEDMDHIKNVFVCNYIKNEIISQIELAGISPANIQYVVPIGAVLGVANPNTNKYDILDSILTECNLVNAEVLLLSNDLRYVNIEKAADFCDALAKRV